MEFLLLKTNYVWFIICCMKTWLKSIQTTIRLSGEHLVPINKIKNESLKSELNKKFSFFPMANWDIEIENYLDDAGTDNIIRNK